MKCLVTGATGFIGAELSRRLSQQGVEVVMLGRKPPLAVHFAGVATVYHCAGIAHQEAEPEAYKQANCRAVLATAQGAAAAGARQFVFLSSVKAGPESEPYGFWKWRAEEELLERYRDHAMRVVIIRPTLVYGVGVKANLRSLMLAVRRGLPTPPPGSPRSMIGLPDLCNLLCCLTSRDVEAGRYIATDGESYDLLRIVNAIRQALGKAPGTPRVPERVWRIAASGLDTLQGRSDSFERLFGGEEYSNTEICQALSWEPRDTLEDLMPSMMAELA
jgi:UDP-glucose 4-epimerase